MSHLLTARADITVNEPSAMLKRLCEHIAEHGAIYSRMESRHDLRFPFGTALLHENANHVRVEVAGGTFPALFDLRSIIAGHMQEFAAQPLTIHWTGDGARMTRPPNYRMLRVVETQDLTPRMRRICFASDDLSLFAGLDNIHVRLVFAPDGQGLAEPRISPDGLESWPDGPDKPEFRRYTIRDIDVAAGVLDIDFVLHAEATGPGSRFAETARAGDRIGMIGPGGGSLPLDRDWYLLAGDETALPAIARFLELLPDAARGHVIIEIANEAERQPLAHRRNMKVDWILRTDGFVPALQCHAPPEDAQSPFIWVGCEDSAFRELRRYVRNDLALKKGYHSIVAYWREGHAAD
ncbi:siderophore-interacting protein [Paracoccus onubensis]|uniref:Siderophore-interacting protein n=1 Tax=Paracoccus onubensis TaxID=1675788 RepID=A0A418STB7_9RHOB|nr:siderophore-interacting protein [Paracoccus onubensis]RJE84162.1 siderophore-interacting protein [Paracoccus onubensis]